MSVKMQLKSTWSTATLDMTLVTNPARRWTFKQVLCQNRRIQNLNYPLCLAKRCQCQERCLLIPRSTLWLNSVATLVSLWASPSCTSSYQSRWFGIKLWFGRQETNQIKFHSPWNENYRVTVAFGHQVHWSHFWAFPHSPWAANRDGLENNRPKKFVCNAM